MGSLQVVRLGSCAEERPDLISILKASLCCCAAARWNCHRMEVGRLWMLEQIWGEDQEFTFGHVEFGVSSGHPRGVAE